MSETPPGLGDPRLEGVPHRVVSHEPASSLEEAARLRGVEPAAVIKTMVVRRGEGDYVFVLVPGDRLIDWPKLRAYLNERRISLPDAADALRATGYVPGTITPLGARTHWPVIADERVLDSVVSIGAGRQGWSVSIEGSQLLELLSAETADVTRSLKDT